MCWWFAASLVAWGALSLVGIWWYPLHTLAAATICLAIGIGCIANWLRNRTLHCAFTSPLFLIAGAVFLVSDARILPIHPRFVWPILAILTGCAFLLEWRLQRVHHTDQQ